MPKIYLGIPVYRAWEAQSARLVMETLLIGQRRGIEVEPIIRVGESLITRARDGICHEFLSKAKDPLDVLLWIDSDIVFDPELPFHVADLASKKNAMVGCAYPAKSIEWDNVVAAVKAGKDPYLHAARHILNPYVPETFAGGEVEMQVTDGCIPVRHLGTGFMAVTRDIYETLIDDAPETAHVSDSNGTKGQVVFAIHDCRIKGQTYLSEDWSICERYIDATREHPLLFLGANLGHIGQYTYVGNVMAQFQAVDK